MNEIAVAGRARLPMPKDTNLSARQWKLLVDVIFPGAKTVEGILNAMDYCWQRKLDIFKRPVHVVPMYNSVLKKEVETVWPGINELEITAHRTKQWAGMDLPIFGPSITREFRGRVNEFNDGSGKKEWMDKSVTVTYPEWVAVPVYRMVEGQPRKFVEQVFWEEIYAKLNNFVKIPNSRWQERPRGQLVKCGKAASLRAAFPEEISEYTNDEMEGKTIEAGGVIIEHEQQRQNTPQAKAAAVSETGTVYDLETGEVVSDKPIPDVAKAALEGDDIPWLDPKDERRVWVEERVAKLRGIQKRETLMKWLASTETSALRYRLKQEAPALAQTLEAAIKEAEQRLLQPTPEPQTSETTDDGGRAHQEEPTAGETAPVDKPG